MSEFSADDIISGTALSALYPGIVALHAIVIVEGLDADTGKPTLFHLGDDDLMTWRSIGMLTSTLDIERRHSRDSWDGE